jgi:hypothetical protein
MGLGFFHNSSMLRFATLLFLVATLQAASPFAGKWNFNISTPTGNRASWLGITEKAGTFEIFYQPTGGHVVRVEDVKLDGNTLKLLLGRPTDKVRASLHLEVAGDKMTGVFKRGETTQNYEGTRAPALKRKMPKAWSAPENLFNGKDLTGWEPIGKPENS